MESLDAWIKREYQYAASAMLKSFSRTDLVKDRPGFGHSIRASAGSIIASPVLASWDPEPDYFFHWYRDSAVVIDALRLLCEANAIGAEATTHLRDFIRFSLSLHELRGSKLVSDAAWRKRVIPDFAKFVRDEADLAAIQGDTVIADTRVNPDGTIDTSKWSRPQHDGPPLRALAMLRWANSPRFDNSLAAEASKMIRADLVFTLNHWREPSFDIWEEESGHHYYTLSVSAAALGAGADWLDSTGESEQAQRCRAENDAIRRVLDGFWAPGERYYRSRMLASGASSAKELDIAVILAAIHSSAPGRGTREHRPQSASITAGHRSGTSATAASTASASAPHTPHDPKILATLDRLEALFEASYPINHNRPQDRGPAMGRYAGDVYFSGGAYYFSTLGAAELCFRTAAGREDALTWVTKGDAYLATVRTFTPPSGELSEQFDQRTGSQTSARHLAWSYAAFISCVTARASVADQVPAALR